MTIHYELEGKVAVLEADNPPVNALATAVRVGLSAAIERAVRDGAEAVVIVGSGRTWFAGADIREFGKPLAPPILPDVCNQIEACPIPVIAAIHGTALGGGLEVALACHYRLALPSARLGLPGVGLGILPGAGGTQRLPRLTGYAKAISMISTGRPVSAKEALATGIIDRVEEGELRALGLAYARALLAEGAAPRPVRDLPRPEPVDFEAAKAEVRKKARGQLSPVVAVEAIEASARLPFDEGLAEERRLFRSLMETDQRKGLIHAFFAERQVAKLPELKGVEPREVNRLGVIGGGTM
ncbi:MAG: enoyl-CoA hydratase/isomerase family protein, partial [Geminicoccaceae bacterium]